MKLISFEEIFSVPVEAPAVILVEGEAGSLKSALCFSLMLDILKDPANFGLYMTFEQNWESHLANMKSLGLNHSDNLMHLDYNIMRKEFGASESSIRIFDSISNILESLKQEKKEGMKFFTLDSLNALYSINERKSIQFSLEGFLNKLRELNLIALIIYEKMANSKDLFRERFLADGIISLGIKHQRGDVIRFLQPLKFSFGEHSLQKRHLVASKEGLALMGSVYS